MIPCNQEIMGLCVPLRVMILFLVNSKWIVICSPKFPLDIDDTDFYLTSRKGGHQPEVIEDLKRGQEGILVKLKQLSHQVENGELKHNNIFYKLGHHDTELKSVTNTLGRLTTQGRKIESKLTQHAFNVEFLHHQLKDLEKKINNQFELEKAVDHLKNRMESMEHKDRGRNLQFDQSPLRCTLQSHHQKICPSDWTQLEDHCYFFSIEKSTFRRAISSCSKIDANLVSIKESTQKSLISKVASLGNQYWTGATDLFSPSQWTFLMSGEEVVSTIWAEASTALTRSRIRKQCGILGSFGMHPINCGHRMHYICEKQMM